MDTTTILELIKARIGISSNVRDTYITAIVNGIIKELEDEKGIDLEEENYNHIMFIVDYATWRYQNRDGSNVHRGLPRNLQFRLHNLIIHNGGGKSDI